MAVIINDPKWEHVLVCLASNQITDSFNFSEVSRVINATDAEYVNS